MYLLNLSGDFFPIYLSKFKLLIIIFKSALPLPHSFLLEPSYLSVLFYIGRDSKQPSSSNYDISDFLVLSVYTFLKSLTLTSGSHNMITKLKSLLSGLIWVVRNI